MSQLNTGKSPESKGVSCAKNEWMYQVVYDGVEKSNADVIIIENAPTLFTNKGEPVANKLIDIAYELGRSISFYKTSTHYHGIPQARDRTFAFIWNLKYAPILNWYKRKHKNFKEYLEEVPSNGLQQSVVINQAIYKEPYYEFIKYKTGLPDVRLEILKKGKTAFQYVYKCGLLKEAADWFDKNGDQKAYNRAIHAIDKLLDGKGIWDASTHIPSEYTQAWIGRNMFNTIHPVEDRSCTVRESLHIMGFPHDFELLRPKQSLLQMSQNVPTCTARDMVEEAIQVLLGNRKSSGLTMFKQNNHNETYLTPPTSEIISLF